MIYGSDSQTVFHRTQDLHGYIFVINYFNMSNIGLRK